jgi:hypothetical protein
VRRLAWETGFQKRAHRKIDPVNFIQVLLEQSLRNTCSYNDLAIQIDKESGGLVSRQAVGKRMDQSCERFIKAILATALKSRAAKPTAMPEQARHTRVLIQDSTIVRLPTRLFARFSGVSNSQSKVCNARIQLVYDLRAGDFVSFSVDPYSKNDLRAAPELELRTGDLVLRDRGYLLYEEIQRHRDAGANCIYRHKSGNTYIDPNSGSPIRLLDKLRQEGSIDIDVCLNNEHRTPLRLVAVPVTEEVANIRRMKLKKETKGHAPSAELLSLMSWTIFITTIPREEASFEQLLDIYALRWRIEIIFKAWKSNLNLSCIHNVSEYQVAILLAARMTALVMSTHLVFHSAQPRIREHYGLELSLMKITKYLVANLERLIALLDALTSTDGEHPELDRLARYCTYEKRNKRQNFNQKWECVRATLALS